MFNKIRKMFMGNEWVDDITVEEAKSLGMFGGSVYINGELIERLSSATNEVEDSDAKDKWCGDLYES